MSKNSYQRIGIYGGTFDPVHLAHLHFAYEFIEKVCLDILYIVPAFQSPFKTEGIFHFTQPENRLAMLKLAFGSNKKIKISKYEISKKSISYSYQTIKYFQSKFPKSELFLLIGSDQAIEFSKWKEWEFILNSVQLVIAERKGFLKANDKELINKILTYNDRPPIWLKAYSHSVSSTEIREMINKNKDCKHLLPANVYEYIKKERLYK